MGGTRALSLATIDVLEDTGRDLRWSRTGWELETGDPDRSQRGTSSETKSSGVMPRRNSSPIRATERKDRERVAEPFRNHEGRAIRAALTRSARAPASAWPRPPAAALVATRRNRVHVVWLR